MKKVKVIFPDGSIAEIDESELSGALAAGAKRHTEKSTSMVFKDGSIADISDDDMDGAVAAGAVKKKVGEVSTAVAGVGGTIGGTPGTSKVQSNTPESKTVSEEFTQNFLDPSLSFNKQKEGNSVITNSQVLGKVEIPDEAIPANIVDKKGYRTALQGRLNSKTPEQIDLQVIATTTNKPVEAVEAYAKGKDGKGVMIEFDTVKKTKATELDNLVKKANSDLGLSDTFDGVFASPETASLYIDKIQNAYDQKTESEFNSLNEVVINGKKRTLEQDDERYIDKSLPASQQFYYNPIKRKNDAVLSVLKSTIGQDILTRIENDETLTYDQKVQKAGKLIYGKDLQNITEAQGKRFVRDSFGSLNPLNQLGKLFRDEDEETKNLNSVNSVIESRLNNSIRQKVIYDQAALNDTLQEAMEKADAGTLTEQDKIAYQEKVNTLKSRIEESQKEYKSPQELQEKYPVLLKQSVIADINEFNAIQSGNVKGYEDSGYKGISLKEHLKAQGYDMNSQVVKDAISDAESGVGVKDYSFFGEPIKAIKEVFTSSGKALGDITGLRDDVTVLSEKKSAELFPTTVGANDELQLTTAASTAQNISNTTGQVIGQGLMQAGTAGLGRMAGLSKVAAANAGFWGSGALTSYDQAYKDAYDFIDNNAGRTAYAGLIALSNAASEKIFPESKIFNIPGVKSAVAELATKVGTGELTDKLANQLLTKAKNSFIDYGKKYASNVSKETLEETATQLFESGTRYVFGDPNVNYEQAMEAAKNTAIQTAIGTSLIGGMGVHKDIQEERNIAPVSVIYNAAVYKDEAMDALAIGLKNNLYDEVEYNNKVALLNTAEVSLSELGKAEKVIGRELSRPQKELFVANSTAQKLLTEQKKEVDNPAIVAKIDEKLKNLQSQQMQLLDNKVQFDDFGNVVEPNKKVSVTATKEETTDEKIIRLEAELESITDDNNPRIAEIDAELTALEQAKKPEVKTDATTEAIDLLNAARETGKLGVFKDMEDNAALEMIAQQAQNLDTKGQEGKPEEAAMAMQGTINQFGEELVNKAIELYPAKKTEAAQTAPEAKQPTNKKERLAAFKNKYVEPTPTEQKQWNELSMAEKLALAKENLPQVENLSNVEAVKVADQNAQMLLAKLNKTEPTQEATTTPTDVKKEGENKDGSIYKSTTKEKNGLVITNYDAYRKEDGKKYSISGRKLTKEEFLSEYEVDEDYLGVLDGAEQVVVREVRDNNGKLGISVRLKGDDGWSDVELAAVAKEAKPETKATPTDVVSDGEVVPVFHHTKVEPKDFDFGNFKRDTNSSQFGNGLTVSTDTTPFLEKRYGKAIKGEVKDSDFVKIDSNKSDKEVAADLRKQGFKLEDTYDSDLPLNENPGNASLLFKDFQKNNPDVKGVKVDNHIIAGQKVSPFYVIYDNKSFYGEGSIKSETKPTDVVGSEVERIATKVVNKEKLTDEERKFTEDNRKAVTESIGKKVMAKEKQSSAKENDQTQPEDNTTKGLLKKYNEDVNYTINDLVNDIEKSGDENLKEAVQKYRGEQEYDREVSGRNDMTAAEDNFVKAVEEATTSQTIKTKEDEIPEKSGGVQTGIIKTESSQSNKSNQKEKVEETGGQSKKSVPVSEEKVFTSNALNRADAKKIFAEVRKVEEPQDAAQIAHEYIANNGKVSADAIDEVAGTVKRASLNTGRRENLSNEVKARDYYGPNEEGGLDAIAHHLWEKNEQRIPESEIKDALMDVIGTYNTRLEAGKAYLEKYSPEYAEKQQQEKFYQEHLKEISDEIEFLNTQADLEKEAMADENYVTNLIEKYEAESKGQDKQPATETKGSVNQRVGNQESAGQAEEKIKAAQSEVDKAKAALKKAEDKFAGVQAQQGNLLGGNEVQKDLFANNPQEVKNVLDPLKKKVREAEANLEAAKKSIGTDNGQPNLFSIQQPTSQEISDMKDIVKDYVDEGTSTLSEIQDDVAKELGDNSQEMKDLVEKAYNEFTKEPGFAPKEVTGGVIGRVGKFLSRLFGGTAASKVFIAKDGKALMAKAAELQGGVKFQATINGKQVTVKRVDVDVVNGFYSPMKAQVEAGQPLFMKNPQGEILGFAHEGKVYLNGEKINSNTPIHEAGHIWTEWAKTNEPEVYARGMQLTENSKYLKEVKANEFYKSEASKLGSEGSKEYNDYMKHEALAMAIGDKGAQFVGETRKKDFKEWLNNLWNKVKSAAGFKDITAAELQNLTFDEFTKRAAADILREEEQPQPKGQQQQQGTGTASAAAPQPKIKSKLTDVEVGVIRDVLDKPINAKEFPTFFDMNQQGVQQTAKTQGEGQDRTPLDGTYVQAHLADLRSISLNNARILQDALGKDWKEKLVGFLEDNPTAGNIAQVSGLLNVVNTDINNEILKSKNGTEISRLKDLQARADRITYDTGRSASLALNQRRMYQDFGQGKDITDILSGVILTPEQQATKSKVEEALKQQFTDAELNKPKTAKPKKAAQPKTQKPKAAKTEDSVKKDLISKGKKAAQQTDADGNVTIVSLKDKINQANDALNGFKC